jgi:hypothetical protein
MKTCKLCNQLVISHAQSDYEPNICGKCVRENLICPWCDREGLLTNVRKAPFGYWCDVCQDNFGVGEPDEEDDGVIY